jgi:hypothetical protein
MFRSSVLALVLLSVLAPAAIAGPCPQPPFSVCEPFSSTGVWYSDATKTTVVGGWSRSCPNINTCIASQTAWGQRTNYSDVECEPCTPCGNCLAKQSGAEENAHGSSCILQAEAQEAVPEQVAQTDDAEECGTL